MTDQDAILSTVYRDVVAVLREVDAEEEWLPTGCAGWSVRDLVFHTPSCRCAPRDHVLRAGDLLRTLVVEAAVHHLDLVVALDRPLPSAGALGLVTETLDGLLGEPLPLPWDDVTYARAGTGRAELSEQDRAALGPLADRFPLFG